MNAIQISKKGAELLERDLRNLDIRTCAYCGGSGTDQVNGNGCRYCKGTGTAPALPRREPN